MHVNPLAFFLLFFSRVRLLLFFVADLISYGLFSAIFKTDSSHPCSFSFSCFTSSFYAQLFIISVEVCSFCFFSFFPASCLHFVLLFWNQTFTRVSDTPNMAPIWSRPCLVTYLVAWKRFSRPRRCSCVKTERHQGRVEVRMGGA